MPSPLSSTPWWCQDPLIACLYFSNNLLKGLHAFNLYFFSTFQPTTSYKISWECPASNSLTVLISLQDKAGKYYYIIQIPIFLQEHNSLFHSTLCTSIILAHRTACHSIHLKSLYIVVLWGTSLPITLLHHSAIIILHAISSVNPGLLSL